MLESDSFIFLLGAGASLDANIPISSGMIDRVETLIKSDDTWKKYKDLYYCIKSGIINAAGITGNFSSNVVNIETLVNTMEELLKSNLHPLYPFIGSWIPRLNEVCGYKFDMIGELKKLIVEKLCTDWTKCAHAENYKYYSNFLRLQNDYNYSLPIFTLNYDLCVENAVGKENVQRGFDKNHIWSWENLEEDSYITEDIKLYKLHGSMDWKKLETGEVEESDNVSPNDTAIIFGTAYKLQYVDPFLYLVNVFRKKTLAGNTKVIICIGYSFNDEHINGIMSQSLEKNKKQKIISIAPVTTDIEQERKRIVEQLKVNSNLDDRIIIENKTAQSWLETVTCKVIEDYIGVNEEPF
ncbi:MAG: SIR2 family protein [Treponema sp.]|nr:SIR2 family protein [Treponema sp.]